MTAERVRMTREGGLAIVTLTRPEAGNALDGRCAVELREIAMRCALDSGVRAVLLRADGRHFCFGGDLNFMGGAEDPAWVIRSTVVDFHLAIHQFATMDAPLVVAVQGAAAGAGLSLAAVGDYVFAADDASFAFAYDAVGLSGDGGVTWSVPRLIGMRAFKTFVFAGKRLHAREACDIGIVSEVVPAAELDDASTMFARKLASGPTRSYGFIKRLLNASFESGFADQLDAEANAVSNLARTDDTIQAIQAMLAKQQPVFNGR